MTSAWREWCAERRGMSGQALLLELFRRKRRGSVGQLALIVVEFAVGGLQNRDLDGARGVAGGGYVFTLQPFLADHTAAK